MTPTSVKINLHFLWFPLGIRALRTPHKTLGVAVRAGLAHAETAQFDVQTLA